MKTNYEIGVRFLESPKDCEEEVEAMTFAHDGQNPISKFLNHRFTPNNYQLIITFVVDLII